MRVALDTAILIRGHAGATGVARDLVATIPAIGVRLVVSAYILNEVERVLRYPRLRALYRLSDHQIAAYVAFLASIADTVETTDGPPIVLRDPNDDPIVYTAWAGQADILCTIDRHFYDPNVLSFCARHRIRVMSDIELLHLLQRLGHQDDGQQD
jgi:putative PIN family toxin of toxin-antitoxin system